MPILVRMVRLVSAHVCLRNAIGGVRAVLHPTTAGAPLGFSSGVRSAAPGPVSEGAASTVGSEVSEARLQRRFFVVALGVSLAVTVALLVRGLIYTHGHLVYVIDDPGIHLAMARNLVDHGTWGVSPGVFEPRVVLAGLDAPPRGVHHGHG